MWFSPVEPFYLYAFLSHIKQICWYSPTGGLFMGSNRDQTVYVFLGGILL